MPISDEVDKFQGVERMYAHNPVKECQDCGGSNVTPVRCGPTIDTMVCIGCGQVYRAES